MSVGLFCSNGGWRDAGELLESHWSASAVVALERFDCPVSCGIQVRSPTQTAELSLMMVSLFNSSTLLLNVSTPKTNFFKQIALSKRIIHMQ